MLAITINRLVRVSNGDLRVVLQPCGAYVEIAQKPARNEVKGNPGSYN